MPSESGTLVPRESDVIIRLRGLIGQLADFQLAEESGKFGRMGFMLKIVSEELFEEIRDYDEMTFRRYLVVVARITEWIATGDMEIIPPDLRPFLAGIEGIKAESEIVEVTPVDA